MVSLPPVIFRVDPPLTVTKLVSAIEPPPDNSKVPISRKTDPVCVFVPVSFKVEPPFFNNSPVPDTTPDTVTTALLSILPPLLPICIGLSMVVAPVTFNKAPPPSKVIVPRPKLASLATLSTFKLLPLSPPIIVVLWWLLLPVNTKTPELVVPPMVMLPLLRLPLKVKFLVMVVAISMVRSAFPKSTLPVKVSAEVPDMVRLLASTKLLLKVRAPPRLWI